MYRKYQISKRFAAQGISPLSVLHCLPMLDTVTENWET